MNAAKVARCLSHPDLNLQGYQGYRLFVVCSLNKKPPKALRRGRFLLVA